MNYFQLFGFDEKFNLDTAQLTQVYQKLQKSVHPDRFAHSSSQEQMLAVQKSSMINDAYQTLKSPLKRAEYMLSLRETPMPNEQASFKDNAFLMRQMELREMLAEVKFADDIDAAVFEANQVLETEFNGLYKTMQIQLAENSAASNQAACEILRKLKFYQKLHIELDRLEDLLFET
ncbi:co-chaperone HscB [Thalassotalea sp. M1531]|uniref:Co-chaperone protein HscB homolog n=1 Tax=Thalassotalea algicola TaxID=2716224 RepID=A0A7Y0LD49_9GAMM|nr:co-chaperone HscB [Thalassotalea algicola]NMP30970.1 co-chaperone HscB [Thalassotalea algicola]